MRMLEDDSATEEENRQTPADARDQRVFFENQIPGGLGALAVSSLLYGNRAAT